MIKEISVQELNAMQASGEDFQLIDVREPHEIEICTLGGESMPVNLIAEYESDIARDKKVVIHCRSGARSANAVMLLQDMYDFDNLYNLKGGILAWAKEIDPSMATY